MREKSLTSRTYTQGGIRGAAGDTRWAMIVSVSMHYLMAGGIFVILKVLRLSPEIAWGVVVFVFMLFSVIFYFRYRGGKWKKHALLKRTFRRIPEQIQLKSFKTVK